MWISEIAPLTVHSAILASLTACAAFAAIWSALAERHRVVRVAAFCGLPAALVVASAPGLAIWVLAEMLPIAAVLIVVPFLARACWRPAGTPPLKLRFDFRDLFFAIFIMALALAGVILLGKQSYVPRLSPPFVSCVAMGTGADELALPCARRGGTRYEPRVPFAADRVVRGRLQHGRGRLVRVSILFLWPYCLVI